MLNLLFEDENGNRFFIQTDRIDSMDEVLIILEEKFPEGIEVALIDVVDDDTAEAMGYDTF